MLFNAYTLIVLHYVGHRCLSVAQVGGTQTHEDRHSPRTVLPIRVAPWQLYQDDIILNKRSIFKSPKGKQQWFQMFPLTLSCVFTFCQSRLYSLGVSFMKSTWEGTVTNCSESNFGPGLFRRTNLMATFKASPDPNYLLSKISSYSREMSYNKKILEYSTHKCLNLESLSMKTHASFYSIFMITINFHCISSTLWFREHFESYLTVTNHVKLQSLSNNRKIT